MVTRGGGSGLGSRRSIGSSGSRSDSSPASDNGDRAGANNSGPRIPPHSLEAEESVLGAILIDNHAINRRQLENLVRAGAFDSLERNRARMFGGIESVLREAASAAQDRHSGQTSLFGGTKRRTGPGGRSVPGTAGARRGPRGGAVRSGRARGSGRVDPCRGTVFLGSRRPGRL